ncbi:MAG: hypothetical protein Q4B13_10275 [Lautropia sp.]|nr:hypothetical protein [Lautropia sp.]
MFKTSQMWQVSVAAMVVLAGCGGSADEGLQVGQGQASATRVQLKDGNGLAGAHLAASSGESARTEVVASAEQAVATAVAPLGMTGVSGAVLATMLDQSAGSAGSYAGAVSSELGSLTYDESIPAVTIRSGLTRYAQVSNPTVPPIYNVAQHYESPQGVFRYDQRQQVQNDNRLSARATRPFRDLWVLTYLAEGANSLTVGNWLATRTMLSTNVGSQYAVQFWSPAPGLTHSVMLTTRSAYRVRKDQEVPFGKVLQQWRKDASFVQLTLSRGADDREVKLCWNYVLPTLGRLYCQVWHVPSGWQAGQPLDERGVFIDDDREYYGGESGHLYWRRDIND